MNGPLPLVSFILICYNQEDVIETAIEGALKQTYANLEIVISDDHSSDRTAIIVKSCIDKYHGSHKIVLNVNDKNLGVFWNYHKALSLTHGSLIVTGAGDDVSYPYRVSTLVSKWVSFGMRPLLIVSGYDQVDGAGNKKVVEPVMTGLDDRSDEQKICDSGETCLGAAMAINRNLVDKFSYEFKFRNLSEDCLHVDRSVICGGDILFVKERLLLRRYVGVTASTRPDAYRKTMLRKFSLVSEAFQQMMVDLEAYRSNMSQEKYSKLMVLCQRKISFWNDLYMLWDGENFLTRWRGFRRNGGFSLDRAGIIRMILLLPRCFADKFLRTLFVTLSKFK